MTKTCGRIALDASRCTALMNVGGGLSDVGNGLQRRAHAKSRGSARRRKVTVAEPDEAIHSPSVAATRHPFNGTCSDFVPDAPPSYLLYNVCMRRWQRLIAVLLLALASVNASAGICAIVCAGHPVAPAGTPCPDHEPVPVAPSCDLAHLCAIAVAPALLPAVSPLSEAPLPAFVASLPPVVSRGIDPDPPLKPPAA